MKTSVVEEGGDVGNDKQRSIYLALSSWLATRRIGLNHCPSGQFPNSTVIHHRGIDKRWTTSGQLLVAGISAPAARLSDLRCGSVCRFPYSARRCFAFS